MSTFQNVSCKCLAYFRDLHNNGALTNGNNSHFTNMINVTKKGNISDPKTHIKLHMEELLEDT